MKHSEVRDGFLMTGTASGVLLRRRVGKETKRRWEDGMIPQLFRSFDFFGKSERCYKTRNADLYIISIGLGTAMPCWITCPI